MGNGARYAHGFDMARPRLQPSHAGYPNGARPAHGVEIPRPLRQRSHAVPTPRAFSRKTRLSAQWLVAPSHHATPRARAARVSSLSEGHVLPARPHCSPRFPTVPHSLLLAFVLLLTFFPLSFI